MKFASGSSGHEVTVLSSDSSPESGHSNSASRNLSFTPGRSVPKPEVASLKKRTFRNIGGKRPSGGGTPENGQA